MKILLFDVYEFYPPNYKKKHRQIFKLLTQIKVFLDDNEHKLDEFVNIDWRGSENRRAHRTHMYEQPDLIIRRGAKLELSVTFFEPNFPDPENVGFQFAASVGSRVSRRTFKWA